MNNNNNLKIKKIPNMAALIRMRIITKDSIIIVYKKI